MTGKKMAGATWHNTTVVLQADIYRQALERGIDISDACNQALAGLTGCEYHGHQQKEAPALPPVIIARNGSSPRADGETTSPLTNLPPVINADDPAAPARVVEAKVLPVKKAPAESPVPVPAPTAVSFEDKPVTTPAAPMKKAAVHGSRTPSAKKGSKGDALKNFFSLKIVRTDEGNAGVGKDDLYELFARFCREHRITPVPERRTVTVALKNKFALTEKIVDGTACWTGIRLK
jgi:hypothetical protein